MRLLYCLLIGELQMVAGHLLGFHKGLEHMQHTHWAWYAFEAMFYAMYWLVISEWLLMRGREARMRRHGM